MNYYSKETYFQLPKIKILQQHIVPENIENIRLQEYAPLVFNEFIPSKSGIKKAIKKLLDDDYLAERKERSAKTAAKYLDWNQLINKTLSHVKTFS